MMSFFSTTISRAREYLGIPSIEADITALKETINETVVYADVNSAKVQAAAHNEQLKFCDLLHELQNSLSLSNAKFDDERRRHKFVEQQLMAAITSLTIKITKLESLVDPRNELTVDHKEQ